ncbi:MAG TPA: phosphoribosyltransferase family protein [Actinomycetes bacterium]
MEVTRFADRAAAGQRLAELLGPSLGATAGAVVLGLARGGIEVAAPVAAELGVPLDVLVVRKVGHPGRPELGLGAVGEDGAVVWDTGLLDRTGLAPGDLRDAVEAERSELRRRVSAYRGGRVRTPVEGRTAVLVDDGIATGVTARAAIRDLRAAGAARVLVAVPVVAAATVPVLEAEGSEVVALVVAARFGAVSQWYADFGQTADATVVRLLAAAR